MVSCGLMKLGHDSTMVSCGLMKLRHDSTMVSCGLMKLRHECTFSDMSRNVSLLFSSLYLLGKRVKLEMILTNLFLYFDISVE